MTGDKMEIRDTILSFLYRKNNGRLTDITEILLPFDNDRLAIQGTLHNLEKDKIVEVDKDYRLLTWRTAGKYRTLGSYHLLARLTPYGESYYKEHYMKEENSKVSIEVKNLQNFNNSPVTGQVIQDSDLSGSDNRTGTTKPTDSKATPRKNTILEYIIYPLVVGVILLIIGAILKFGFDITI